jgi:hypothetical protein
MHCSGLDGSLAKLASGKLRLIEIAVAYLRSISPRSFFKLSYFQPPAYALCVACFTDELEGAHNSRVLISTLLSE